MAFKSARGGRGTGRSSGKDSDSGTGGQLHSDAYETLSQHESSDDDESTVVRRGPAAPTPLPEPRNREHICVIYGEFSNQVEATRIMGETLQAMWSHPWNTWKDVSQEDENRMFDRFKLYYQWDNELDGQVRSCWLKFMKRKVKDLLNRARNSAKAATRNANVEVGDDLSVIIPYKPRWMGANIWESLVQIWNTDKWKTKSSMNASNRGKSTGGKHTLGSQTYATVKQKLEKKLGRPASVDEIWMQSHGKKGTRPLDILSISRGGEGSQEADGLNEIDMLNTIEWVDTRAENSIKSYKEHVKERYGDNASKRPLFDQDSWIQAVGGKKKGRIYGFNDTRDPHVIMSGTPSMLGTTARNEEVINPSQHSNKESNTLAGHIPNPEAKDFYDMLQAADEPLWEGKKEPNCSKLEAATNFLNWKSLFNVSNACYNHIITTVKAMMPEDNKLPESFYDTKKILEKLSLPKERIDVCKNHCMLFYKNDKTLTHCKHCGQSRYKSNQNKVSNLVMTYMPIGPRLKKLYMSIKTAKYMTWHHDHKTKDGSMAHPSDGKAWKHFNLENPDFANEIRNVRLGLCTDGFNPNNSNSNPCSLWPVFLTVYNFPPWMSLKDSFVNLSLLIPGKKSPGQNVDVFLRPLIDELKQLYTEGIEVYDTYRKENFMMKAILLWTVSDFPAYAMLSGWSTHGNLACPYCMGDTHAFRLHFGVKPSWFDCHRRFLPATHSFRSDRNGFRANKSVPSSIGPPPNLSGWDLYEQVFNIPTVYEGTLYDPKKKDPAFGITHNWVKKSIFWELDYWPMLLIRHNLDVMHIEKNVFENLFQTIMDTPKTKDNIKARMDIKEYCNRPSLHTWMKKNNKYMKPKASYTLTKSEVNAVCNWLKKVKFPDGYASNIGGCVNVKDGSFYSMKSHDCHVFMQRLLPIVLRGMLPKQIFEPIVELCTFFRVICSKVLHIQDLQKLQQSIVVTLCKLEKIFPPGFFDSMEHLVIHLTNEAILGGPVQFRWMYPYERKLGRLKRTIKNKARLEGSIVESYLIDELSHYCSLYLDPTIKTRLNREPRNFAPNISCLSSTDSRLSIFKHPSRRLYDKGGKTVVLTDEDKHKAHTYILFNCQELHDSICLYDEELRAMFPNFNQATLDKKKEEDFAKWLKDYVLNGEVNAHLRDIAHGPLTYVQSHKGYLINGYKFHTRTAYHGRVTENSGVCVKGASYNEYEKDYYGLLDEILELEYHSNLGTCVVVLFKCTWFDPVNGIRVNRKTNMVDVNSKAIGCVDDPFILASQAHQVYYTPYPSKEKGLKDWWAVIKTTPKGVYELAEDDNVVGDDDNEDMEHFFQDNERLVCSATDDLLPISHVETNIIEEVDDVNADDDHEEGEFEDIGSDDSDEEFDYEDSN